MIKHIRCMNPSKQLKKFTNALLSVIFTVSVISSIQYASADHSLGGQGIFKDEIHVNIADSIDSKYLLHLQVVVRDAQGYLVSVTEAVHGSYIPHSVSDHIFDEYLGKKEIVNIDNMRYEMTKFTQIENVNTFAFPTSSSEMNSQWKLEFCLKTKEHGNEQGISCIPVFQVTTAHVSLWKDESFTINWTILREN